MHNLIMMGQKDFHFNNCEFPVAGWKPVTLGALGSVVRVDGVLEGHTFGWWVHCHARSVLERGAGNFQQERYSDFSVLIFEYSSLKNRY